MCDRYGCGMGFGRGKIVKRLFSFFNPCISERNSRRAEWDTDLFSASRWRLWKAMMQCFLGYCCKQSRAVLINTTLITTLICIIQRQDEKKIPQTFLKTVSSPQRYIHINSYSSCIAICLASQPIWIVTHLNRFSTGSRLVVTSLVNWVYLNCVPSAAVNVLHGKDWKGYYDTTGPISIK